MGSSILLFASGLFLIYITCSVQAAPCLSDGTGAGYRVEHCPKGWVRYSSSKCFKFFATKLAYGLALKACESLDAALACLASAEEHEFLKIYILRHHKTSAELQHVWLGGEFRGSNWFWMDLSPFEYINWYAGYGGNRDRSDGYSIAVATHSVDVNGTSGPNPSWGNMFTATVEHSFPYICQKYQTDARAVFKIKD